MTKSYTILVNILLDIEEGIKNKISVSALSKRYKLSEIHLRRLFKFTFNKTISGYIRSRTLTESLNDLFYTDKNIIDIALEYGFSFEQSYINSFKREFRITPGNCRKTRQITNIQPPLHLKWFTPVKGKNQWE